MRSLNMLLWLYPIKMEVNLQMQLMADAYKAKGDTAAWIKSFGRGYP